MKRNILLGFIIGTMALGFMGCQSGNIDTNNSEVVSRDNSGEIESEDSKESGLSKEEQELIDAARKNEIVSILSDFAFDDTSGNEYEKGMGFNELLEKMETISQENMYAEEFADNARGVNYNGLNENCQLVFDVYIKLLFDESSHTAKVTSNLLGAVDEGWFGEYAEGDVTDFFIRFSGYPKPGADREGRMQYIYIKRINGDGRLMCNDSHWLNAMKENEENRVLHDWYGNALFKAEDIGVDSLNEFLTSNQGFMDYLINFRDNVYAPIRNEELEEEKNIADEKRARDKKLSESIPKIGMTREEVKKSKWGNPDKINKDTYSWGTEEQWVYKNKGYVYFKNGIVTSVSER